jgi:signal transduction histidine kinase
VKILWVAQEQGSWSAPPSLSAEVSRGVLADVSVVRTAGEAEASLKQGEPAVLVVVPRRPDDPCWELLSGSPGRPAADVPVVVIAAADDRARAWAGGAFDVLDQADDDPQRLVVVLERADHYRGLLSGFRRERAHLTSVLSHDLKNPLSAVLMTAHMLQNRLPEKERPAIDRIRRAGQRMQRMIQEIVDFTHLQQGIGIVLRPHACDLGRLCRNAIDELARVQPGQTVVFEGERPFPGTWDGERLEQLVFHMLSHALLSGLGVDGTTLILGPEDPAQVTLTLSCRGPAPPDDYRAALVDPLGADPRSALARSGMGLFIARAIAEAHGGELLLGSGPTGGLELTLHLPRTKAPPLPPPPA